MVDDYMNVVTYTEFVPADLAIECIAQVDTPVTKVQLGSAGVVMHKGENEDQVLA
ncbi:hypothetical protein Lal_00007243 [Lupinus albus]|nr:hypothetical protein Lal_00007243 [Lupinus albus]